MSWAKRTSGFRLGRTVKRSVDPRVKIEWIDILIYTARIEILMVCTGNICRSPMAEFLLRDRAARLRLPVQVSSAGLVCDHEPAQPHAVDTLERVGLDLTAHRSRIIDYPILAASDLIIGMESRHVREVCVVEPEAFSRTFTLPDLVTRAEAVGPRRRDSFEDWLAEVGDGRKRIDMLQRDHSLEVSDPMGGSRRAFRRCAEQLTDLVDRLVAVAWPETDTIDQPNLAQQPSPRSS